MDVTSHDPAHISDDAWYAHLHHMIDDSLAPVQARDSTLPRLHTSASADELEQRKPRVEYVRLSSRKSKVGDSPSLRLNQSDDALDFASPHRRPSFTSFKPGKARNQTSNQSLTDKRSSKPVTLAAHTAAITHADSFSGQDANANWFSGSLPSGLQADVVKDYNFDVEFPDVFPKMEDGHSEAGNDVKMTKWTDADVSLWFQSIDDEDFDTVFKFLESGFDVDTINKDKRTALMLFAKKGRVEQLRVLLNRYNANINKQGENGETALHLACRSGHAAVVASLLESGSDITLQLENGGTALHCACQAMETQIVEMLLMAGSDMNAVRTGHSTTRINPLHDATEVGDLETVELLLDTGFDADVEKGDHTAALHTACRYGYLDIAECLLKHGASPSKTGNDSHGSEVMPMHVAAEYNHPEIITLLAHSSDININTPRVYVGQADVTCLHLASMRNHLSTVRTLLELGHDASLPDSSGTTALHLAAKGGFMEVAQCLLEANADIHTGANSKNSRNQTPLHLATRFKCHRMVQVLIDHGADINASESLASELADETARGYTALHWATENNDLEMVKILLKNDADVNASASFDSHVGVTALHLASQDGFIDIVEELVKVTGINMNPKKSTSTRENITPLHQTVYNRHTKTAVLLLEHGADPNIQSDNGYAAIHYATQQTDPVILKCLIEHGADVNAKASGRNQSDVSPLHLAVQSGNTKVVGMLVKAGGEINASKTMGETSGVTPLLQAVYQQKLDVIKTLLNLGCDVSLSMSGWYAPLHVAAERGNKEILVELLRKGALIDQRATFQDHSNVTPLHVAAQHGHTEIVRFLISGGADLKASRKFVDRQGMTPLHLATENGFVETVAALCQLGSDLNAQDSLGFTALHLAIQYNFHDIVEELLQAGASLKLKTVSGLTPLKLAQQTDNGAAAEKLKTEKKRRTTEKGRGFSPRGIGGGNAFRFLLCGTSKY